MFLSFRADEKHEDDIIGDIDIKMGTEQQYKTQKDNSADELPTSDDLMTSEPTVEAAQPSDGVTKHNDTDGGLESFIRISSETVAVNLTDQSVTGKNIQSQLRGSFVIL